MSKVSQVKRGRIDQPIRTLLYSVEGLGKSTFASQSEAPVFIGPEDETARLDVARFPDPSSWTDALESICSLATEKHDYRTIVIDTVDWLEPMLWEFVCKRDREPNIQGLEKGSKYGYGRGYIAALDEWRVFVSALDNVRRVARMHVILLAHTQIKMFKNPEGDDYDRYSMKMQDKASGFLKEWCDSVLFGTWENYATKDGDGRVKGVATGARVIHTERRAAWDAKNRFGLPEQMPLDWATYAAAIGKEPTIEELRAACIAKLATIPEEKRGTVEKWLATPAAQKLDALRVGLNKIASMSVNP